MAKLKERSKRFTLTPFPYCLKVIVTNDIRASYIKLADKMGNQPLVTTYAVALTVDCPGMSYILLPDKTDIDTIAHEVTHAILFFKRYVGVGDEDEFMAHYIGYYVAMVAKFVLQKEKHVTKNRSFLPDCQTRQVFNGLEGTAGEQAASS